MYVSLTPLGATRSTPTERKPILFDRGTRASAAFGGVVSTAVSDVPDVRTITRFRLHSID